MCGIVAIWNRDGAPVDVVALERAVDVLRFRGPDDEGYLLVDSRSGRTLQCRGRATDPRLDLPPLSDVRGHSYDLAFGHRRLAIVDPSLAGHQPMAARHGESWIVFNGMIHNFLEIRRELEGHGHLFRSGTDTEVILHGYDEWGPACVDRFNGMWAFVIWDARRRVMFASRDRLGIKPLLCATRGPVVAFASDLRAFRPFPRIPRELDPEAVHHYLSLMKVPAPLTIYQGVRKVLPGHSVTVAADAITDTRYWQLEPPVISTVSGERAATLRVIELIEDSVRLRLVADVPIGSLLSGGVDSSIVTAVAAARLPSVSLQTFSLSFPDAPDVDEAVWAARVATHLGTPHHVVRFSAELLGSLPDLVGLFDEPFAVSSALGVYRLAQVASHQTKVLLTGDGGDEIFAGYPHRHWEVDQLWDVIDRQRLARFRSGHALAAGELVRWRTASLTDRLRRRLDALALSTTRARDRFFNARRTLFNQSEKHALYTPDWRAATRHLDTVSWLGATLPRPDGDRLARWQVHDVRTSLHDEMLAKVDRAAAACGIEARPPLLDHRLVELAVGLAASLKLRHGEGKWILKKAGERYVPSDVLWRPKQGFTLPLARWFTHEWRSVLGDALSEHALRRVGVFEPHAVTEVLAYHEAHPTFTTAHMVYTLLCFQIWHTVSHQR